VIYRLLLLCLVAVLLRAGSASAADADSIRRGAYLAAASGCESCHTDTEHGGPPLAGGRVMHTPYGDLVTPNLTPDRATGIGRWNAQDFAKAMRWGIAPDDTHYVPTFPFPYYNRLSDADLADLQAYFASLAPVSRPGLGGAASAALWERARAAVATALSSAPGPWKPDPRKNPAWNRGAYLVATIGRCGHCHTPTDWLGIPDEARPLAGTRRGEDGKPVPNITPDQKTGIGNWSEDDIVQVLTDGHTPDFDEVGGSMVEIVKATGKLSDDDRRAIAIYLQDIPALPGPERK
jgi:mono/diheme cytochrome c family protein